MLSVCVTQALPCGTVYFIHAGSCVTLRDCILYRRKLLRYLAGLYPEYTLALALHCWTVSCLHAGLHTFIHALGPALPGGTVSCIHALGLALPDGTVSYIHAG